jgi:eukaryotic-like serine/threonine-protein kinase
MSDQSSLDPARPVISAGTWLNNIYEVDSLIATGGMGEVYRGHTIETCDPVAIKLIRSDLAGADAAFALFRKEAAALRNIYHEAIVRYYVFTTDPGLGRPYLAMEFVDGKSLSAVLRKGPLACETVYDLMVRIASGLQAAHEQDIVHRDISPDNIIIPDGNVKRAKIIDFGIARSTRLDSAGTIIGSGFAGKYNYVSPEQLGLFGGDVTPKSDIYSLALILVEALLQKPINMGGNHIEVIEKRRKVPDLSAIDPRLRPLLQRMLQPNPNDRPASMAEVAAWPLPPKPRSTTVKPVRAKTGGALRQQDRKTFFPVSPLVAGAAISLAIVAGFGIYVFAIKKPEVIEPPIEHKPVEVSGSDQRSIANTMRYLDQYDGGPCFFIKPLQVTDDSALVEGYGMVSRPFNELDTAFRRKIGFEATIGLHQIEPAQCPALFLLGQLRNSAATTAPKIVLASTALKLGQNLTGTIEGIEGRQIDLLLVTDNGTVRRLAATSFPPANDKLPFSAKLDGDIANGKLQLLVAIASPKPLPVIEHAVSTTAEKLFQRVVDDAKLAGPGVSASLRSFRLDK